MEHFSEISDIENEVDSRPVVRKRKGKRTAKPVPETSRPQRDAQVGQVGEAAEGEGEGGKRSEGRQRQRSERRVRSTDPHNRRDHQGSRPGAGEGDDRAAAISSDYSEPRKTRAKRRLQRTQESSSKLGITNDSYEHHHEDSYASQDISASQLSNANEIIPDRYDELLSQHQKKSASRLKNNISITENTTEQHLSERLNSETKVSFKVKDRRLKKKVENETAEVKPVEEKLKRKKKVNLAEFEEKVCGNDDVNQFKSFPSAKGVKPNHISDMDVYDRDKDMSLNVQTSDTPYKNRNKKKIREDKKRTTDNYDTVQELRCDSVNEEEIQQLTGEMEEDTCNRYDRVTVIQRGCHQDNPVLSKEKSMPADWEHRSDRHSKESGSMRPLSTSKGIKQWKLRYTERTELVETQSLRSGAEGEYSLPGREAEEVIEVPIEERRLRRIKARTQKSEKVRKDGWISLERDLDQDCSSSQNQQHSNRDGASREQLKENGVNTVHAFDESFNESECENGFTQKLDDTNIYDMEVGKEIKHNVLNSVSDRERKNKGRSVKTNSKDSETPLKMTTAVDTTTQNDKCEWQGNLKGIFDIEGTGYDVMMTEKGLCWESLTGSSKVRKKKSGSWIQRARSGTRERKLSDEDADTGSLEDNCVTFRDIIGVKIQRMRRATQQEGEGVCQGFNVHTYYKKDPARYRRRTILLGHPSDDICRMWALRIEQALSGFTERPRRVKLFMQPFAGKRDARNVYKTSVLPLFTVANLQPDLTEVNHNEHIKQELIHLDLDNYDSVVCMGGDGTVNKVMSGLLTRAQHDHHVDMTKPGASPARPAVPLGILPVGSLNQTAHTVMGTTDVVTATIHILLGHRHHVDVCSVLSQDKLVTWSLNAHYGYFANVLSFLHRYSMFGEKKLNASFVKALTKAKFRSYECDVAYVASEDIDDRSGDARDERSCRQGCPVCDVTRDRHDVLIPTLDDVECLGPLHTSNTSSAIQDLTPDPEEGGVRWRSVKGDYLSVSVLSGPGLSDLAPRGMSKYSHLADGCLDLVLVRNTVRREFERYLKRHGNAKNQMALPFVDVFRCREVRFHARFKDTWGHLDLGFNELSDRVKKQEGGRQGDVEVISDLKDELKSDLEEESEEDSEGEIREGALRATGSPANSRHTTSAGSSQGSVSRAVAEIQEHSQTLMNVSSQYRPTLVEQERARRMKRHRRKLDKTKVKAEAKLRSMWSIDNELLTQLDLHFRVHQGLVTLHGQGIPRAYSPDDVTMGCLALVAR